MWNYVFSATETEGSTEHIRNVVELCIIESGLSSLEVRQPYFHDQSQVSDDFFDGSSVPSAKCIEIVAAILAGDVEIPWCKFESGSEFYINFGWDDEVYVGSEQRCARAENLAAQVGLIVHIADRYSPYLKSPGDSIDPPANEALWNRLRTRLVTESLFVLERWAGGTGGESGYLLHAEQDVTLMSELLRPRCALAVFAGSRLMSATRARGLPTQGLARRREGLRIISQVAGKSRLASRRVRDSRMIDDLLADINLQQSARILITPPFPDQWSPPEVETYVRPDDDGVIRSRLGFHIDDSVVD
jgi:hypothetical protein